MLWFCYTFHFTFCLRLEMGKFQFFNIKETKTEGNIFLPKQNYFMGHNNDNNNNNILFISRLCYNNTK